MAYSNPDVADFKTQFSRDFSYGASADKVTNNDITSAESDAAVFINPNLFANQDNYSTGFLILSAHFLVMNLRASSQGLTGQFGWLQSSKSVGSVSESFSIPDRIMANPEYAMLTKTYYGAKFLMIVLPQLSGQIFVVGGCTSG